MAARRTFSTPTGKFRSKFEAGTAQRLAALGVRFEYEPKDRKVRYTQPEKQRIYTPDFVLSNGIYIETKGEVTPQDRQRHQWIREQHPELDIRFVFANAKARLSKISKTTYAKWAEKNGFKWAHRQIPVAWIQETKKSVYKRGLERMREAQQDETRTLERRQDNGT